MCFVFLYLHLFSAIEHVSQGKCALEIRLVVVVVVVVVVVSLLGGKCVGMGSVFLSSPWPGGKGIRFDLE